MDSLLLFSNHIILICRFELAQESDVVFEIESQVAHLIFQHGNAFNTHAKGETCVFLAVDAAVFQHVGVNHAAA